MSKFQLVSGIIFEDGTLIPAGKVVDLDESAKPTQDYLKRGSIKPYTEGEEEVSEEPTPIEGEVRKEFELEGFTYKQIQAVDGVRYTQNDVEISEDAFVSALQITISQEEVKRHTAEAEAARNQSDTASLAPVPPVVGGQAPTQEQIDEDLKAVGV